MWEVAIIGEVMRDCTILYRINIMRVLMKPKKVKEQKR